MLRDFAVEAGFAVKVEDSTLFTQLEAARARLLGQPLVGEGTRAEGPGERRGVAGQPGGGGQWGRHQLRGQVERGTGGQRGRQGEQTGQDGEGGRHRQQQESQWRPRAQGAAPPGSASGAGHGREQQRADGGTGGAAGLGGEGQGVREAAGDGARGSGGLGEGREGEGRGQVDGGEERGRETIGEGAPRDQTGQQPAQQQGPVGRTGRVGTASRIPDLTCRDVGQGLMVLVDVSIADPQREGNVQLRRATPTQIGVAAARRVQEKLRHWGPHLEGLQPAPHFYACVAETFGLLSEPLRQFLGLCAKRIAQRRRDRGGGDDGSARIFEAGLTTRLSVALQRAQAQCMIQHASHPLPPHAIRSPRPYPPRARSLAASFDPPCPPRRFPPPAIRSSPPVRSPRLPSPPPSPPLLHASSFPSPTHSTPCPSSIRTLPLVSRPPMLGFSPPCPSPPFSAPHLPPLPAPPLSPPCPWLPTSLPHLSPLRVLSFSPPCPSLLPALPLVFRPPTPGFSPPRASLSFSVPLLCSLPAPACPWSCLWLLPSLPHVSSLPALPLCPSLVFPSPIASPLPALVSYHPCPSFPPLCTFSLFPPCPSLPPPLPFALPSLRSLLPIPAALLPPSAHPHHQPPSHPSLPPSPSLSLPLSLSHTHTRTLPSPTPHPHPPILPLPAPFPPPRTPLTSHLPPPCNWFPAYGASLASLAPLLTLCPPLFHALSWPSPCRLLPLPLPPQLPCPPYTPVPSNRPHPPPAARFRSPPLRPCAASNRPTVVRTGRFFARASLPGGPPSRWVVSHPLPPHAIRSPRPYPPRARSLAASFDPPCPPRRFPPPAIRSSPPVRSPRLPSPPPSPPLLHASSFPSPTHSTPCPSSIRTLPLVSRPPMLASPLPAPPSSPPCPSFSAPPRPVSPLPAPPFLSPCLSSAPSLPPPAHAPVFGFSPPCPTFLPSLPTPSAPPLFSPHPLLLPSLPLISRNPALVSYHPCPSFPPLCTFSLFPPCPSLPPPLPFALPSLRSLLPIPAALLPPSAHPHHQPPSHPSLPPSLSLSLFLTHTHAHSPPPPPTHILPFCPSLPLSHPLARPSPPTSVQLVSPLWCLPCIARPSAHPLPAPFPCPQLAQPLPVAAPPLAPSTPLPPVHPSPIQPPPPSPGCPFPLSNPATVCGFQPPNGGAHGAFLRTGKPPRGRTSPSSLPFPPSYFRIQPTYPSLPLPLPNSTPPFLPPAKVYTPCFCSLGCAVPNLPPPFRGTRPPLPPPANLCTPCSCPLCPPTPYLNPPQSPPSPTPSIFPPPWGSPIRSYHPSSFPQFPLSPVSRPRILFCIYHSASFRCPLCPPTFSPSASQPSHYPLPGSRQLDYPLPFAPSSLFPTLPFPLGSTCPPPPPVEFCPALPTSGPPPVPTPCSPTATSPPPPHLHYSPPTLPLSTSPQPAPPLGPNPLQLSGPLYPLFHPLRTAFPTLFPFPQANPPHPGLCQGVPSPFDALLSQLQQLTPPPPGMLPLARGELAADTAREGVSEFVCEGAAEAAEDGAAKAAREGAMGVVGEGAAEAAEERAAEAAREGAAAAARERAAGAAREGAAGTTAAVEAARTAAGATEATVGAGIGGGATGAAGKGVTGTGARESAAPAVAREGTAGARVGEGTAVASKAEGEAASEAAGRAIARPVGAAGAAANAGKHTAGPAGPAETAKGASSKAAAGGVGSGDIGATGEGEVSVVPTGVGTKEGDVIAIEEDEGEDVMHIDGPLAQYLTLDGEADPAPLQPHVEIPPLPPMPVPMLAEGPMEGLGETLRTEPREGAPILTSRPPAHPPPGAPLPHPHPQVPVVSRGAAKALAFLAEPCSPTPTLLHGQLPSPSPTPDPTVAGGPPGEHAAHLCPHPQGLLRAPRGAARALVFLEEPCSPTPTNTQPPPTGPLPPPPPGPPPPVASLGSHHPPHTACPICSHGGGCFEERGDAHRAPPAWRTTHPPSTHPFGPTAPPSFTNRRGQPGWPPAEEHGQRVSPPRPPNLHSHPAPAPPQGHGSGPAHSPPFCPSRAVSPSQVAAAAIATGREAVGLRDAPMADATDSLSHPSHPFHVDDPLPQPMVIGEGQGGLLGQGPHPSSAQPARPTPPSTLPALLLSPTGRQVFETPEEVRAGISDLLAIHRLSSSPAAPTLPVPQDRTRTYAEVTRSVPSFIPPATQLGASLPTPMETDRVLRPCHSHLDGVAPPPVQPVAQEVTSSRDEASAPTETPPSGVAEPSLEPHPAEGQEHTTAHTSGSPPRPPSPASTPVPARGPALSCATPPLSSLTPPPRGAGEPSPPLIPGNPLGAQAAHGVPSTASSDATAPIDPADTATSPDQVVSCPTCRSSLANRRALQHHIPFCHPADAARRAQAAHDTASIIPSLSQPRATGMQFTDAQWQTLDSVDWTEYFSPERIHTRPLRRVPERVRGGYLDVLSAILVRIAQDPEAAGPTFLLAAAPTLFLVPATPPDRSHTAAIAARISRFGRGEWAELVSDALGRRTPLPRRTGHRSRTATDPSTADERRIARCLRLAACNETSRACAALESAEAAPDTQGTIQRLQSKHPNAERPTPAWLSGFQGSPLVLSVDHLRRAIFTAPRGSSGGPSGWVAEHLRDTFLAFPQSLHFLLAVYQQWLRGRCAPAARSLLASSTLVALAKSNMDVRPIAIGEVLVRILSRAVCLQLRDQMARVFLASQQFGVGVMCGTEVVVRGVRRALADHPDWVVLQLDVANAFNSFHRDRMFQALQASPEFQCLIPFIGLFYGTPSDLHYRSGTGVVTMHSERGTRQGDPLIPFLYALTQRLALEPVLAEGDVQLWSYADDTYVLGPPDRVLHHFAEIVRRLGEMGLAAQPHKCLVYQTESFLSRDLEAFTGLGIEVARRGLTVTGVPGGGAGAWLTSVPYADPLRIPEALWQAASSSRLGLPIPQLALAGQCSCGQAIDDMTVPHHAVRCPRYGVATTIHDTVKYMLRDFAVEAGFAVKVEDSTLFTQLEAARARLLGQPVVGEGTRAEGPGERRGEAGQPGGGGQWGRHQLRGQVERGTDLTCRDVGQGLMVLVDVSIADPQREGNVQLRRATPTQIGVAAARRVQEKLRHWGPHLEGLQPAPHFYACVAETFGLLSEPLRQFLGLCAKRIAQRRRDRGGGDDGSARIFEAGLTTRLSVALQRAQAQCMIQHAMRQLGSHTPCPLMQTAPPAPTLRVPAPLPPLLTLPAPLAVSHRPPFAPPRPCAPLAYLLLPPPLLCCTPLPSPRRPTPLPAPPQSAPCPSYLAPLCLVSPLPAPRRLSPPPTSPLSLPPHSPPLALGFLPPCPTFPPSVCSASPLPAPPSSPPCPLFPPPHARFLPSPRLPFFLRASPLLPPCPRLPMPLSLTSPLPAPRFFPPCPPSAPPLFSPHPLLLPSLPLISRTPALVSYHPCPSFPPLCTFSLFPPCPSLPPPLPFALPSLRSLLPIPAALLPPSAHPHHQPPSHPSLPPSLSLSLFLTHTHAHSPPPPPTHILPFCPSLPLSHPLARPSPPTSVQLVSPLWCLPCIARPSAHPLPAPFPCPQLAQPLPVAAPPLAPSTPLPPVHPSPIQPPPPSPGCPFPLSTPATVRGFQPPNGGAHGAFLRTGKPPRGPPTPLGRCPLYPLFHPLRTAFPTLFPFPQANPPHPGLCQGVPSPFDALLSQLQQLTPPPPGMLPLARGELAADTAREGVSEFVCEGAAEAAEDGAAKAAREGAMGVVGEGAAEAAEERAAEAAREGAAAAARERAAGAAREGAAGTVTLARQRAEAMETGFAGVGATEPAAVSAGGTAAEEAIGTAPGGGATGAAGKGVTGTGARESAAPAVAREGTAGARVGEGTAVASKAEGEAAAEAAGRAIARPVGAAGAAANAGKHTAGPAGPAGTAKGASSKAAAGGVGSGDIGATGEGEVSVVPTGVGTEEGDVIAIEEDEGEDVMHIDGPLAQYLTLDGEADPAPLQPHVEVPPLPPMPVPMLAEGPMEGLGETLRTEPREGAPILTSRPPAHPPPGAPLPHPHPQVPVVSRGAAKALAFLAEPCSPTPTLLHGQPPSPSPTPDPTVAGGPPGEHAAHLCPHPQGLLRAPRGAARALVFLEEPCSPTPTNTQPPPTGPLPPPPPGPPPPGSTHISEVEASLRPNPSPTRYRHPNHPSRRTAPTRPPNRLPSPHHPPQAAETHPQGLAPQAHGSGGTRVEGPTGEATTGPTQISLPPPFVPRSNLHTGPAPRPPPPTPSPGRVPHEWPRWAAITPHTQLARSVPTEGDVSRREGMHTEHPPPGEPPILPPPTPLAPQPPLPSQTGADNQVAAAAIATGREAVGLRDAPMADATDSPSHPSHPFHVDDPLPQPMVIGEGQGGLLGQGPHPSSAQPARPTPPSTLPALLLSPTGRQVFETPEEVRAGISDLLAIHRLSSSPAAPTLPVPQDRTRTYAEVTRSVPSFIPPATQLGASLPTPMETDRVLRPCHSHLDGVAPPPVQPVAQEVTSSRDEASAPTETPPPGVAEPSLEPHPAEGQEHTTAHTSGSPPRPPSPASTPVPARGPALSCATPPLSSLTPPPRGAGEPSPPLIPGDPLGAQAAHGVPSTASSDATAPIDPADTATSPDQVVSCPTCRSSLANRRALQHHIPFCHPADAARRAQAAHDTASIIPSLSQPRATGMQFTDAQWQTLDSVDWTEYFSPERIHTRPLRRVPERVRGGYLDVLSAILVRIAQDPEAAGPTFLLAAAPTLFLVPATPPDRSHTAAIAARISRFGRGEWAELVSDALGRRTPLPRRTGHRSRTATNPSTADERRIARCLRLAACNETSRACAALESAEAAPDTQGTIQRLQSKHPNAERPTPAWLSGFQGSPLVLSVDHLRRAIFTAPRGSSGGPSSWVAEHLRDTFLAFPQSLHFLLAVYQQWLRGRCAPAARSLLASSTLVALAKSNMDVRPIAIGEVLVRILSRAVCLQLRDQMARVFLASQQFGVGVMCGTEVVVRGVRRALADHPDWVVLQLDVANAFNSFHRDRMFQALQASPEFQCLIPFIGLFYGTPSDLHYRSGTGVVTMHSERGTRQGDPLSPFLYALTQRLALEPVLAEGDVQLWSYADDTYVLGPPARVLHHFAEIVRRLGEMGLAAQPHKCLVYQTESFLSRDLEAFTGLGIEVARRGLTVTGVPVGTVSFVEQSLPDRLERMGRVLPWLPRLRQPQTAARLLSACVSTRPQYLSRTVPPSPAVISSFTRWDARLGETFQQLLASGTWACREDVREAALDQIFLPIRLGGFGIRRMARIAPVSFVCSWVQCAPILCSLPACGEVFRQSFASGEPEQIDRALQTALEGLPPDVLSLLPPRPSCASASPDSLFAGASRLLEAHALEAVRARHASPLHLARLTSLQGGGAGAWLTSVPYADPLRIPEALWQAASSSCFGLPIPQLALAGQCSCGQAIDDMTVPHHAVRCPRYGVATTIHDTVKYMLRDFAVEAGFAVKVEDSTLFTQLEAARARLLGQPVVGEGTRAEGPGERRGEAGQPGGGGQWGRHQLRGQVERGTGGQRGWQGEQTGQDGEGGRHRQQQESQWRPRAQGAAPPGSASGAGQGREQQRADGGTGGAAGLGGEGQGVREAAGDGAGGVGRFGEGREGEGRGQVDGGEERGRETIGEGAPRDQTGQQPAQQQGPVGRTGRVGTASRIPDLTCRDVGQGLMVLVDVSIADPQREGNVQLRRATPTQIGVAAARRVQEKLRHWGPHLEGLQPAPHFYACVAETFGLLSEPMRQFLGLCAKRIAQRRRDRGGGDDGSARIFEAGLTTRLSVALQRAQAQCMIQHAVRQLGRSDDGWMPAPVPLGAGQGTWHHVTGCFESSHPLPPHAIRSPRPYPPRARSLAASFDPPCPPRRFPPPAIRSSPPVRSPRLPSPPPSPPLLHASSFPSPTHSTPCPSYLAPLCLVSPLPAPRRLSPPPTSPLSLPPHSPPLALGFLPPCPTFPPSVCSASPLPAPPSSPPCPSFSSPPHPVSSLPAPPFLSPCLSFAPSLPPPAHGPVFGFSPPCPTFLPSLPPPAHAPVFGFSPPCPTFLPSLPSPSAPPLFSPHPLLLPSLPLFPTIHAPRFPPFVRSASSLPAPPFLPPCPLLSPRYAPFSPSLLPSYHHQPIPTTSPPPTLLSPPPFPSISFSHTHTHTPLPHPPPTSSHSAPPCPFPTPSHAPHLPPPCNWFPPYGASLASLAPLLTLCPPLFRAPSWPSPCPLLPLPLPPQLPCPPYTPVPSNRPHPPPAARFRSPPPRPCAASNRPTVVRTGRFFARASLPGGPPPRWVVPYFPLQPPFPPQLLPHPAWAAPLHPALPGPSVTQLPPPGTTPPFPPPSNLYTPCPCSLRNPATYPSLPLPLPNSTPPFLPPAKVYTPCFCSLGCAVPNLPPPFRGTRPPLPPPANLCTPCSCPLCPPTPYLNPPQSPPSPTPSIFPPPWGSPIRSYHPSSFPQFPLSPVSRPRILFCIYHSASFRCPLCPPTFSPPASQPSHYPLPGSRQLDYPLPFAPSSLFPTLPFPLGSTCPPPPPVEFCPALPTSGPPPVPTPCSPTATSPLPPHLHYSPPTLPLSTGPQPAPPLGPNPLQLSGPLYPLFHPLRTAFPTLFPFPQANPPHPGLCQGVPSPFDALLSQLTPPPLGMLPL
ncbi:unnamed protein product, partial [Closterium sp. NIES-65]